MNQTQKRIMNAVILGAVMGLAYEFVITPYITKPITDKVEEVIDK